MKRIKWKFMGLILPLDVAYIRYGEDGTMSKLVVPNVLRQELLINLCVSNIRSVRRRYSSWSI